MKEEYNWMIVNTQSNILLFQVRKSFFSELNINNNMTIVDLLYQQFYSGSQSYPTEEEQEFMRTLFTSETFVKNEFRYHKITRKGHFVEDDQLGNWTAYLEQFREYIEKGFQFTRLAVQEPYGVMILKASYGMKHRLASNVTGKKIKPRSFKI